MTVTPSALACLECRKRHLKCNAGQPKCSRCEATSMLCTYVTSRRGLRHGQQRRTSSRQPPRHERLSMQQGIATPHATGEADVSRRPDITPEHSPITTSERTINDWPLEIGASVDRPDANHVRASATDRVNPGPQRPGDRTGNHLIDHYYTDFHHLHPILPPQPLCAWGPIPQCLHQTMQLIGSHYCSTSHSDSLNEAVKSLLAEITEDSYTHVQTYMLYSIILHARNEFISAQEFLAKAIKLANVLGLTSSDYAATHEMHSIQIQDSLRSTWWELLCLDTMMAAIAGHETIIQGPISDSFHLPRDIGRHDSTPSVSPLKTLANFRDRIFSNDETIYSSFTYRIEAALALRQVLLITATPDATPDDVQAVDNWLVGWVYHLPKDKSEIVNVHGKVDLLMLQAHILTHWAMVLLHLPRSNLLSGYPTTTEGLPCSQAISNRVPSTSPHIHAINAVTASKAMSNLLSLRVPFHNHSPMLVCAISLAAMVQITACQSHGISCSTQHRHRVTLILGLLKSLGPTFPIAARAGRQIKQSAAMVFQNGGSTITSAEDPSDNGIFNMWPSQLENFLSGGRFDIGTPSMSTVDMFPGFQS